MEDNKMKKSETKKYIAVIDPKVEISQHFEYKELSAKHLAEAMSEANELFTDDVYLIDVYMKQPGGDKEKVLYQSILTNRGHGWNIAGHKETLAFYYKHHDAGKEIKSCDVDWVF